MPKAKEIIIGLAAIGLIATATACGTGTSDGNNAAQNEVSETDSANTENTDNNETAEKDDVLTLGSTFEFDNLEITLGTEIGWTTVDNQFSDQNGADVFYIPITGE